ncbi:MAG: ABC transporter ATP-binding protein [Clostridiales bacterium]|nr:ABC transporter ATP-binding protein [Clostridiales bacterium]
MKELLLSRKKQFIVYIIACLFPVVSQISTNYVISLLIGTATEGRVDMFWQMLWLNFVVVAVALPLLFVCSRMMRIGFIRDIILDVRKLAFDKIQSLSFEGFNKKSKATYMSHLINDINLFEEQFFLKLINVIFRGGAYAASLVILAFYDIAFSMIILVTSILVFLVIKRLEGKTIAMQENISESNENLTVAISNTFEGLSLLKLNRVEETLLNKNIKSIDHLEKKKMNYQVFTESQRNVTRLLSTFIFIGILLYCLNLIGTGIATSQIVFMIVLANGCIWPLEQLIPLFNELKGSLRIFEKITTIETHLPQHEQGDEKLSFNDSIELKDVSFSYEDKMILNHVNLKLEKNKKYLLKGASGAGKSTLMKILSQTYFEYEGEINYDNVELRSINSEDYNSHVAFIYQDVFLFEDTMINNLTLFRDIDAVKLEDAISRAGLTDFIDDHPDKLNRVLEENGLNLSGGQRQRVSIARALIKDVDIVFSDEATSSLNAELGAQVEQTLLDLPCTLIAVSHRYYPGITENYDGVIEIKNGKVQLYPIENYFQKEVSVS